MRVEVYGHSDDCIEIDGDLTAEFYAYDKEKFLHFSDGTVLGVCHAPKDDPAYHWRIRIMKQGTASIEMLPGAYHDEEPGDKCDKAVLTGDLKWVRCHGKPDGPTHADLREFFDNADWSDYDEKQLRHIYDVVQEIGRLEGN